MSRIFQRPGRSNKMKFGKTLIGLTAALLFLIFTRTSAQEDQVKFTPTPILTVSGLELEKKQLEIDRLQLENDRLKLEMEKLKFQASMTPGPVHPVVEQNDLARKVEQEGFFLKDASQKAGELALKNKDAA